MQHDTALLFQFPDEAMAAMAADTLSELGYEPDVSGGREVHIHLHGSDLTSALEIAQSHGGVMCGQSRLDENAITASAYSLDAITIPAHLVNEDLIAREESEMGLRNHDEDAADPDAFTPDPGTYDHFSGDVHT
ncbi:hypothetical protein [Paenibacillus methanolicus]|uniref:Uncharacterized protein n=1 Tax=Paenibacillus methanolicus TaxID=582686 RepID=A0A5S5C081_9BACL|nr:hypothetical protein [Paenibacillus methanolicus]TYP71866.1 hypothetical protein BCM02_109144 [Paenibacillus methanolicus]